MFTVFRSFFTEGAISGALLVTVDAAGYIVPCGATGFGIGTVEMYNGNQDSQFDVNTNANLPVTVRLFSPTRMAAITGVAPTGFSAGTLLYQALGGYYSLTGTAAFQCGIALQAYPVGAANGGQIEVANSY
jgi:hypothetical protein